MPQIDLTARAGWEDLPSSAERTMLRLLLLVDRRGRYDGRLPQLAVALWPRLDGPTPTTLGETIKILAARELLTVYEVGGLPYIEVHGKGAGQSKWPDPPGAGQIEYVPDAADPEVIRLPCVRGREFVVLSSHLVEWRKAYPAVDIENHLQRMLIWLRTHPTELKTLHPGIHRFIHRWLGKEQDKAGRQVFKPAGRSLTLTGLYGHGNT